MDEDRFDELTRAFAASPSRRRIGAAVFTRRRLVRGVGAVAALVGLGGPGRRQGAALAPCNEAGLSGCLTDALFEVSRCESACSSSCRFSPNSAACSVCRTNQSGCFATAAQAEQTCRTSFGCQNPATVCVQDLSTPNGGVCCPAGLVGCGGQCQSTRCFAPTAFNQVTCACECPHSPFGSPLTPCGAECVDVRLDARHCGACGNGCVAGRVCQNGTCVCPPGRIDCGGACVLSLSDPNHCGACGNVCAGGKECRFGQCLCPIGLADCGGVCADLSDDPAHCGSCSNACTGGKYCEAGLCRCAPGWTDCDGTCVYLPSNVAHCGACDTPCSVPKICQGSQCVCPPSRKTCGSDCCAVGQDCCGGVCTTLDTTANCGSCGAACAAGWGCCDRGCKDLQTDPAHCGACPTLCLGGKICQGGQCVCPPNRKPCGQPCCPVGWDCCNGTCVPLTTNANCGACGVVCKGGKTCAGGACVCPTGFTDCGGVCVNLLTDHKHCGTCPTDCTAALKICQSGQCVCPPNSAPCFGSCCETGKHCVTNTVFPYVCCPPGFPVGCPPIPSRPDAPNGLCCAAGKTCCASGCC